MTKRSPGRPRKYDDDRKSTTVRLPETLLNSVKSYASVTGQSVSDVITSATVGYLGSPTAASMFTSAIASSETTYQSGVNAYQSTIEQLAGEPQPERGQEDVSTTS